MNKHSDKNKKGFTLIELLIVVAIIGILATLVIVAIQNSRTNARDSKRLADIKQMQTALELYFNDNKSYPTAVTNTIATGSTIYMEMVPTAPTPADGSCTAENNGYTYSSDGSTYSIFFCLGSRVGGTDAGQKEASASGIANITPPAPWACGDTLTDSRDSQQYPTVQIGTQCWIATGIKYDNGCSLQFMNYSDVGACSCPTNCTSFGRVYQWSAVMNGATTEGAQGICPAGWHVPKLSELGSLFTYLSANSQYWCGGNSAYISKSLGSASGWSNNATSCGVGNDQASNNTSGFNAFPIQSFIGGNWEMGGSGSAYFWSSTPYSSTKSYVSYLTAASPAVASTNTHKGNAFFVRCLKD